ncbi:MAG: hypothetical protein EZS28_046286, partial [Streblomastix strix]
MEEPAVKETHEITENEEGTFRSVNQYIINGEIGKGAYGQIWKCYEENEPDIMFALKIIKKPTPAKRKLFGPPNMQKPDSDKNIEVALLKKISHPNIVRLHEVIDNQQST